jgi:CelD/BcsL family acetyltransferase involved in cellulose biosynthesis
LIPVKKKTALQNSYSVKHQEDYIVELCDNEESFRKLSEEWDQLLDNALRKSFFLTYDWMYSWWSYYYQYFSDPKLFIITVRNFKNELVGVLPLYRDTVGKGPLRLKTLRFLGTAYEAPEHLDAIVHVRESQRILEKLFFGLESFKIEYDALQFTDLSEDAVLFSVLPKWSQKSSGWFWVYPWMDCPFLEIQSDFESYLKRFTKKARYNLRWISRKLASQYDVSFEVSKRPAEVQQGLEDLFSLHKKRWAEKEENSAFNNELSMEFHRRLSKNIADQELVRVFVLKCDNHPVAAIFGYLFAGRFYYYQSGFDPAFMKMSVGTILLNWVIRYCFEEKYREFDFLRGLESYKLKWTKQVRQTFVCELALSPQSKLYFGGSNGLRGMKKRFRKLQTVLSSFTEEEKK